MEPLKEKIFIDYVNFLCSDATNLTSVGRRITSVRNFLSSDYPPNRRGYKKYMAENYSVFMNRAYVSRCLCDFLAWRGMGYHGRKKMEKKSKTLEKLDIICDKNMKILNDFHNYLATETDMSHNSVSSYTTSLKLFFQYSTEFSAEMCRAYIATMEKDGAAPATINLRIVALRKFGEFIKKPIVLKKMKIQKALHTENVPTLEEYNRLLSYLKEKNMNWYFYIRILATTGARVSEFLQMTWEDVVKGEVTLKGKGSKYRHFFYSKDLVAEARQYMKDSNISGIICRNRSGFPMGDRGLSQQMKAYGKHCNIDPSKLHPHAFRHFFAKMYLKKNKDIVQLANLLGHSSIDTTRIYLQKSYLEQRTDFAKNVTW